MEKNDEVLEIDRKLEKRVAERKEIELMLAENTAEINSLETRKAFLLKKDVSEITVLKSIPDHLEEILTERGATHCKILVEELKRRGVTAAKYTVSTALMRNAKKGKRFVYVGPNIYDVLKGENK